VVLMTGGDREVVDLGAPGRREAEGASEPPEPVATTARVPDAAEALDPPVAKEPAPGTSPLDDVVRDAGTTPPTPPPTPTPPPPPPTPTPTTPLTTPPTAEPGGGS
jgi:hypothetical protein